MKITNHGSIISSNQFLFIVNGISTTEGIDSRFQSISGLSTEIGTEDMRRRRKQIYPSASFETQYPNLVLKRGLIVSSGLISWCRNAMETSSLNPET
ncbi:hypothetical protein EJ377_01960 [Chryseobacterium arthrosphaerae]|uniref:Uncharacterized protein n=1 Tax=Chryseobacterium arthrosphaerae TaxID=651561 RepID=A0A3S0VJ30_9FLAO|nr:hypothetical protein EJ377_01960 [Chryseobacterium arthrosphaerae]